MCSKGELKTLNAAPKEVCRIYELEKLKSEHAANTNTAFCTFLFDSDPNVAQQRQSLQKYDAKCVSQDMPFKTKGIWYTS